MITHKLIKSTKYTDIENDAHIDEILSCHAFIDEPTANSLYFDEDNFRYAMDTYLKNSHKKKAENSTCICSRQAPIRKAQAKITHYLMGDMIVEQLLCDKCGYVFNETQKDTSND